MEAQQRSIKFQSQIVSVELLYLYNHSSVFPALWIKYSGQWNIYNSILPIVKGVVSYIWFQKCLIVDRLTFGKRNYNPHPLSPCMSFRVVSLMKKLHKFTITSQFINLRPHVIVDSYAAHIPHFYGFILTHQLSSEETLCKNVLCFFVCFFYVYCTQSFAGDLLTLSQYFQGIEICKWKTRNF